MAQNDGPPTYTEATKDGPPAYTAIFPVKEMKSAKEESPNQGVFAAKVCELLCGSFACMCCLLVMAALPIAMIVIGSIYLNSCPGQRFIPIWLIVFGSISLFHTIISMLKYCAKTITKKSNNEESNKNQKYASRGGNSCESLLSLFLFIWTIVGSVWVFGYYYSVWAPQSCISMYKNSCQCEPVVFMFSYITLIVMYSIAALICCCGCFCVLCIGIIAGGASSGSD